MGQPKEVFDVFQGDKQDGYLFKRLEKAKSDASLMQKLDSLWNDNELREIQDLKRLTSERLQTIMWDTLRNPNAMLERDEDIYPNFLDSYTFICIRHIRDPNCCQKSSWVNLYTETERLRKVHQRGHWKQGAPEDQETDWLRWLKNNSMLSEEDVWEEHDKGASDNL